MNILTFGSPESPAALFFQGSCSHWSWYRESIDLLAERYYVIVPELDGYSPGDNSYFTSVEQTVAQVTDYLRLQGIDHIYLAYGLSMGGAMVIYLLGQNRLTVQHAVIDGGITPYRLPPFIRRLIAVRDYWGFRIFRRSGRLIKAVYPPERWLLPQQDISEYPMMQDFFRTMSKKTIWNTFVSANYYTMPGQAPAMDTAITYLYGGLEKKARKWDIDYILDYFPQARFMEAPNFEHGELVIMKPKAFAACIERITKDMK